jgi:hypothetical protein
MVYVCSECNNNESLCFSTNIIYILIYHWRSGTARGFLPQGCGFVSHPVDRLSTEPVCVGSRLHKPVVYTKRPGGHRRQMEARSRVLRLTGYAYSHPIPMGRGSGTGLCASAQCATIT